MLNAKWGAGMLKDNNDRDHGDRLFEVNSTNSFKNLSP